MIVDEIKTRLKAERFPLESEKELQREIWRVLQGMPVEREYRLDGGSVVDFMVAGVGIEVKIGGRKKAIYRQVLRYCGFEEVKALVVVTNRSLGLPETLNDKPVYVLKLGTSWL